MMKFPFTMALNQFKLQPLDVNLIKIESHVCTLTSNQPNFKVATFLKQPTEWREAKEEEEEAREEG